MLFIHSLKKLRLNIKGLKELHNNCFSNMKNLTSFVVLHASLSLLPNDFFKGLTALETIINATLLAYRYSSLNLLLM